MTDPHQVIAALRSELADWVAQYGCDCRHPACSRCYNTRTAYQLLKQTEEASHVSNRLSETTR